MKKTFAAIALITCMILSQVLVHTADACHQPNITYTSLGDSVSVGVGASVYEQGYVNKFTDYLDDKYGKVTAYNFGKQGGTSVELLESLTKLDSRKLNQQDATLKKALKNSDIITINTGSLNIQNIIYDFFAQGEVVLDKQVEQFNNDWPQILKKLRKYAPNAKIYTMTVYNPLKLDDTHMGIVKTYQPIENCILKINKIINDPKLIKKYDYHISDVYTQFKELESSQDQTLCHFYEVNPETQQITRSPYPTDYGYSIMYELQKSTFIKSISKRHHKCR